MFVGHLALALAGKRAAPDASLGWHMAAVTALDLVWPVFVLMGVERVSIVPGATAFNPLVFDHYPWSHSLVMAVGWGILLAGFARAFGISRRTALVLWALVVSHWVLDFVTHAPDMPFWPGSARVGLGLWNSIPGTLVIEGAIWIAGIALYLRGRRSTRWIGPAALWSLIIISTVMWAAGPWSPPPPDVRSLGLFALIGWIMIPWAALADRYYATDLSASDKRQTS
jgi:membrane-bound metal-dependent hydrolase YbcI (DUF457 family)